MNDVPLVSIAAINYNSSEYVIETLESIRNQTYPNIELVIVDDCSTDNSIAVIDNWLSTFEGKFKFIKHEVNKGVCVACNSGLNNATGKYFSIIATDDLVVPEKIATQIKILEGTDTKVGAVYSDAYLIDVAGKQSDGFFIGLHRQFSEIPSGNIYETLLQGNYIPGMTFLFKRFVFADLGGYDESLAYEDFDMWLRIARKYEILFSDYPSAKYRVRPGSLTNSIKNWELNDAKIFAKHATSPIPMVRIRQIAYKSYLTGDSATMHYLKELIDKTGDTYTLTAWLLWRFRFPVDIGTIILTNVVQRLAEGLPERIIPVDNSDTGLFINYLLPLISIEEIRQIVYKSYLTDDRAAMPYLKEIIDKIGDRYMLATWLLWRFRFPTDQGKAILTKVTKSLSEGLPERIVSFDNSDKQLFINYLLPVIPIELLTNTIKNWELTDAKILSKHALSPIPIEYIRQIAYKSYLTDDSATMPYLKEIIDKTGDRYTLAAWLLWRFKFEIDQGTIILTHVIESLAAGLSEQIIPVDNSDSRLFINYLLPVIPTEFLKNIAFNAYTENNTDLLFMVKELAKNKKDKHFKTLWLLWKYKIRVAVGEIIYARIDGYCKAGKSNFYIDLRIYKDLLDALIRYNSKTR